MRKILLSAICLLATVVTAAKTSVMAKADTFDLWNDATKGFVEFGYSVDFGYGANTGYAIDAETNAVTASATAGLYSNVDLLANINFMGLFVLNLKLATVPIAVNPISTSAQWTHPLALSQGEEMTGVISAGYTFTIGDVQLYYFVNHLTPKVSFLDYITGTTSSLIPGDITTATVANSDLKIFPFGFEWNSDPSSSMNADPYCKFNLGDWISENTDFSLITSGDYIEPLDLFAEYNETK
jgi:hypothetical protein